MSLKFSIEIPLGVPTPGEFQTLDAIAEMAAALDRTMVDGAFVTDHPSPDTHWLHQGMGHDALDPFTALAFVGSASRRLMLHTNIIVAGYRNPFLLAKSAASLQTLSDGRLILGMGAGYQKVEFDALGADFKRRGKLFDEALEVLRLAWSGGPVSYKGMDFDAVEVEPRPALVKAPPVWIGGSSPAALERAGKFGDGWCPFFAAKGMSAANRDIAVTDIPDLIERRARIEEVRQREGRTDRFDLSAGPPVKVGWLGDGNVAAYIDAVGEMAEAGVTWISAMAPHASRAQYIEAVEWYGSEVIAKIRG
jgi:probable F420-dependent oxidoreductase